MRIPFETMQDRFLVYVYVGVWVIQLAYLGRITWQWFHTPKPVSEK
ncbi:hypothetical protein SAMN05421771_1812 [Granulicella pectinivorans]|jgi:hypothetical protein|uniref:Uncharacterized protein n=1 Tax=Granulicella pectinivorans TaxID=474950 RepID=A0A1I6M4G1_9BACT|nr:hypothetical protein [Granulicella pectinivorans]SFS10559.1 hypothetical protein SAMN05421771_1812 [Granulicella pectinivorans]